jgi:putative hemolysin
LAIEAVEDLASGVEQAEAREVRFSYSRPEQPLAHRAAIRLIERLSGQTRLERLYRQWSQNPRPGENIFAAAVRMMDIAIDTDEAAWSKVPRQGPVLFVANHPFGVIDGLLIGHLATRIRPDTKIMTHSLLCQPPEARDFMLPVDFGGTPEAQQTSLLTRRRTLDWLMTGHAVAVFPAGGVSTAQSPLSGPALDPQWHPFVGKLARLPGLTIIPVCFHGQNSRLFHIASHIHYVLRIALLFRETARRIGTEVKVSVGDPVTSAELCAGVGRENMLHELRRRTLSLAGEGAPDPCLEFRWPDHVNPD